jgi:hypothetical protein
MSLSSDVWGVVLSYAPDWPTFKSLAACNWQLRYHAQGSQGLVKYATSEVQRVALRSADTWETQVAVLNHRCMLCHRAFRGGHVEPVWRIYAHASCISKEVLPIPQCCKLYDMSFENLRTLLQFGGCVWKFHGGRDLPFSLLQTLQGLCLTVYKESLQDRLERISALHSQHDQKLQEDSSTAKRKSEEMSNAARIDMYRNSSFKKQKLAEQAPRKKQHLANLFVRYPNVPQDVATCIESMIMSNLTLPVSWKRLDDVLHIWSRIRFQCPDGTIRQRLLHENPKSALRPFEFQEAYNKVK